MATGGPGEWQLVKRGKKTKGFDYQTKRAGVPPQDANGYVFEYEIPYPPAKEGVIRFDAFAMRNGKPVFIDEKSGYDRLLNNAFTGSQKMILDKMLAEAQGQMAALRYNHISASIEWAFSSKQSADIVAAFFRDKGIPITVVWVP